MSQCKSGIRAIRITKSGSQFVPGVIVILICPEEYLGDIGIRIFFLGQSEITLYSLTNTHTHACTHAHTHRRN